MIPKRVNGGFLAKPEGKLLDILVTRVPARVGPDTLTAIGVGGAVIGSLGFAMGLTSYLSLFLVFLGILLNWAGDSLDGKIARHRKIERKVEGFILDNGVDLISYLLLCTGFALSGLVSIAIPFVLLAFFMLLSNLALARMLITGVHNLAIETVGTTELRVAFLFLAVLLFVLPGFFRAAIPWINVSVLDGLSLLWAGIMLPNFVSMLRRDMKLAHHMDQRNAQLACAQAEPKGPSD